ncbi:MAG: proline iminopeptidase-family hydrolase [Thermomicrobia bacterium]|nr:proline iminopeptidase-family hydrolase [Thermomicrobia bacterium]
MHKQYPSTEGRIPFHGYETWYRVVGAQEEPGKLPLLTLHGGPGACHDYLESMEALAATGRRVIFYDQLGCGHSAVPSDPSLWTVGLYVEEVNAVRHALRLERVHLLGQSWGGMLGMEYALTQPTGLASLIIESSPSSMTQWVAEANKLREALPPDVQRTLLKHEADGTTNAPAYEEAMMIFYQRHVCRLPEWPDYVQRSFAKLSENPEVYYTMNGPSEFHVTGTLKTWDITDRLGEIRVPTLVLSGRHDEATPAIHETVHHGISGSESVIFEESAHMCHVEEPERFQQVVGDFLARVEAR